MEPSHRDQMESSAAVGFPPAYTHRPLTFYCHTALPLLFNCILAPESVLFSQVQRLFGWFWAPKNIHSLPFTCLLHPLLPQSYPLLCFHAVRPICGLCIEETEFNLTVLEGYVHPAIHPEPSQCINPWTQPGAVSLGRRLFLVLEVCSPQTRPGIARVK